VIRQRLEPKRCSREDIEKLERLLPAAAGLFGNSGFRTRELLLDPGIAGLNLGGHQALGNLLSRAASDSVIVAGLVVERVSQEHGAAVWVVANKLPGPIDMHCAG
jgi:hypothetical protein